MTDQLAVRVFCDRDNLDLPSGSVVATLLMHRDVHDDPRALEFARRGLRRKVSDGAARELTVLHPADVTVAEVTPEELAEAWRTQTPMDPPPLADFYALVGYWQAPRPVAVIPAPTEGARP